MHAVREETHGHVRRLTLCRPDRYNTITPQLRDELGAAIDTAERDSNIRVILLDAEGKAFCAGYDLDWSTDAQAAEEDRDEFTARQALEMGAVLEVVPDDDLHDHTMALAQRIAQGPSNQLEMITWSLNFVERSTDVGFRDAVRERDRPFGDYGERTT